MSTYSIGGTGNELNSFAAMASPGLDGDETHVEAYTATADINGDGLEDLVSIKYQNGAGYWSIRFNKGGIWGPRIVTTNRRGIEFCNFSSLANRTCGDRWRPMFMPLLSVADTDNDGRAETQTGATRVVQYLLTDRLGSVDAIAYPSGALVETRGYDAFGKPRTGTWADATPPRLASTANTPHGFTGHEHLNSLELIHMNGRVYDYNLGRFMEVDPIIQSPLNSQSLNPYSYIGNNPLSGTDPTGYFGEGLPCIMPTWACRQQVTGQGPDESFGFLATMAKLGLSQGGRSSPPRVSTFNGARSLAQLQKSGALDKLLANDQRSNREAANGAVDGATQGALSGQASEAEMSVKAGEPTGDGTEGAPEQYISRIRDHSKRQELLREMGNQGYAYLANDITYVDDYDPKDVTAGAHTIGSQITFFKRAFEGNYQDIFLIMRHESVHWWQNRLLGSLYKNQRDAEFWNAVREEEAYRIVKDSPDFKYGSKGFKDTQISKWNDFSHAIQYGCRVEDCSAGRAFP